MKRLAIALVLVTVHFSLLTSSPAQTPSVINYQGKLINGTNLVSGQVGISLRIYTNETGGVLLYEDSNTVNVVDGLYSTFIGDGTTFGNLTTALAAPEAKYIEVAINGTALSPREPLTSVAYARTAVLKTGDMMTGPLNMNVGADNQIVINSSGVDILIGNGAVASNFSIAMGVEASADEYGNALGFRSVAIWEGVSVGDRASSYQYGVAVGPYSKADRYCAAIGSGSTASNFGVAVGPFSFSDYSVAVGYLAEADGYGIAIGPGAVATSSLRQIAIGKDAVNTNYESVLLRGTLYLDGAARSIYYRPTFGSGGWTDIIAGLATGTPLYVFTEVDPLWAAVSNSIQTQITDNYSLITNRVAKTGDTMTGALTINEGGSQQLTIRSSGSTIAIGNGANADNNVAVAIGYQANGNNWGTAIGSSADATNNGAALGAQAVGSDTGAAVGLQAKGNSYGAALGARANGNSYGAAVGYYANGSTNGAALGSEANGNDNGAAVGYLANGNNRGAAVGYLANGNNRGAAVGNQANGSNHGAAMGYQANGSTNGVAIGDRASGSKSGVAVGLLAVGSLVGAAVGAHADASDNGAALGNSANGSSYGVGVGFYAIGDDNGAAVGREANGESDGAAVGYQAKGSSYGAALGYNADGAMTAVAIGREANGNNGCIAIGPYANSAPVAQGIAIGYRAAVVSPGSYSAAIGYNVTNDVANSTRIRGNLYLDGGQRIYTNSNYGAANWGIKAFTIDHPLDPQNKVLRHFCVEGPVVWDIYAGNVQLQNGEATVELPAYYSALNLAGSEIYSLTPIGDLALVCVKEKVKDNRFVIKGDKDIEVSWTVKAQRNDPAAIEDLKQRPVEQLKSELKPGQVTAENAGVNADTSTR